MFVSHPRVSLAIGTAVVLVLSAVTLLHSSQQRPGFPTEGSSPVQVSNEPTVHAAQAGDWRVSVPDGVVLARGSAIQLESPPFVQPKRTYLIRWDGGQRAAYTIIQINGSWAEASGPTGRSWINLAMATEIAEGR